MPLSSLTLYFISHTIRPADLFHPSPASHFKIFQEFPVYFPDFVLYFRTGYWTLRCKMEWNRCGIRLRGGILRYGVQQHNRGYHKKGDYYWFLSNTAKVAMKLADRGESRCVAHSEIALDSHNEFILLGCPIRRAGPRYVGAPSRLIIWRPFKLIFFKLFQRRTGLANIFEGACPKCE